MEKAEELKVARELGSLSSNIGNLVTAVDGMGRKVDTLVTQTAVQENRLMVLETKCGAKSAPFKFEWNMTTKTVAYLAAGLGSLFLFLKEHIFGG